MSVSKHSPSIIRQFFNPSIMSGFLSILFGFILFALTLYYFVIKKSEFSEYYEKVFAIPAEASEQLALITYAVDNNALAADSAIFLFWAVVGTLFYLIGEIIYKSFSGGKQFFDEMNLTQPKGRLSLLGLGLQHIFLRVLGLVGVYALYKLVIVLLPFAVLNIYRLININEVWTVILLLVSAFLLGMAVIHWLTLCLRLITYRLRVIGSIDS